MKCDECKINYPSGLVSAMFTVIDGHLRYRNLCGICALEATNKAHGIKRTRFDGPLAEKMRQKAIKFREGKSDAQQPEH